MKLSEKTPIYVAELSINHLGMVEIAKKMIKTAAKAGADIVKLKKKKVEDYYKDKSKKWRYFNFIEYRKSLELSKKDFEEIDNYCKKIGMPWYATVHDKEGRSMIRSFDPPMYKIASMDSGDDNFVESTIEICSKEEKPMVISMGGKTQEDEAKIVGKIKESGIEAYVLHCVSMYPTPFGKCNINHMKNMIEAYSCEKISVGYSGHEKGIAPSILAATYGAKMIERHLTLTRDFNIHHIDAAITPTEFKEMTKISKRVLKEKDEGDGIMNESERKFIENKVYE